MNQEPRNVLPPHDLPDLTPLELQGPRLAANKFFHGGGAKSHGAYLLQFNAIRLADCAIEEYQLARMNVLKFHQNTQSVGLLIFQRAQAHFESCIWALERFINFAQVLRSSEASPLDLRKLISRRELVIESKVRHKISEMRNTLAHLERDALEGKLPQGSSITLLALESGLSVGEILIPWTDLIAWLTSANACAVQLSNYGMPQPPAISAE